MFENGLFIFRRDLRIIDNTGLNELNKLCKKIYTIFIFTPEQVTTKNNFKSNNAVQFMIESLYDLEKNIHSKGGELYCFYGLNNSIINRLISLLKIDIVYFNQDYSPYALKRDHEIVKLCETKNIIIGSSPDYYLHEPGTIFSGQKTPYKKFTPYYETSIKKKIDLPVPYKNIKFAKTFQSLPNEITLENAMRKFTKINPNIAVNGGRVNALILLKTQ
jgi:deoxyribodipyrimidine photo-lyase